MTRPVVFLGPTLPVAEAMAILDADYRPPAEQGDVYKAARDGARVILIIDGYFQSRPAVWHKEILWALSQGVHVIGAASMGALRAAELGNFGMVGIGEVYRDYKSGKIERDDEVAVLHAPQKLGFRPMTISTVDIRATVTYAKSKAVIDDILEIEIPNIASRLFFAKRTWKAIFASTKTDVNINNWLIENFVSQKRDDASSALKEMANRAAIYEHSFEPMFDFEDSILWMRAKQRINNSFFSAFEL